MSDAEMFQKFWTGDKGSEGESRQDRVTVLMGGLLEGAFEEGLKFAKADRDRLAAELERVREACKPFNAAGIWASTAADDDMAFGGPILVIGDYRKLAAALAPARADAAEGGE